MSGDRIRDNLPSHAKLCWQFSRQAWKLDFSGLQIADKPSQSLGSIHPRNRNKQLPELAWLGAEGDIPRSMRALQQSLMSQPGWSSRTNLAALTRLPQRIPADSSRVCNIREAQAVYLGKLRTERLTVVGWEAEDGRVTCPSLLYHLLGVPTTCGHCSHQPPLGGTERMIDRRFDSGKTLQLPSHGRLCRRDGVSGTHRSHSIIGSHHILQSVEHSTQGAWP